MFQNAHLHSGLHCRNLVKQFGPVMVLRSVNFSVQPGQVVALIGENGAGKSTFNNIVAGVLRPTQGQMWLDGIAYDPHSPNDAMTHGVALIHQEIRLLPQLSVAENIFMGRLPLKNGRIYKQRMYEEAEQILTELGVNVDPRHSVAGLSMAVQQGIEIAKAILRKPRYVIFDEPTASVGEAEAHLIFEQIRKLKSAGTGIIYVSHRLEEIKEISDRVVCFRDGTQVGDWPIDDVSRQDMINAMVGRDFTFEHRAPNDHGADIVLSVRDAARQGAFEGINFDVHHGEIFGLAGLVGSGRTEIVRALSGADRLDQGTVTLDGNTIRLTTPADAIRAGIVMVSEDRKGLGLTLGQAANLNIAMPWEKQLAKFGCVFSRTLDKLGRDQKEKFDIRGQMGLPVGAMSGGNQQKILLAKWLVQSPRVFIVDEPTRGVDVGAKMAIYEILRDLANQGIAVIVVSSELEEVIGLSHRVLVMSQGRQQGILTRQNATPQAVMSLAVAD